MGGRRGQRDRHVAEVLREAEVVYVHPDLDVPGGGELWMCPDDARTWCPGGLHPVWGPAIVRALQTMADDAEAEVRNMITLRDDGVDTLVCVREADHG